MLHVPRRSRQLNNIECFGSVFADVDVHTVIKDEDADWSDLKAIWSDFVFPKRLHKPFTSFFCFLLQNERVLYSTPNALIAAYWSFSTCQAGTIGEAPTSLAQYRAAPDASAR